MARTPLFDWYLTEWMAALNVSQADLCRETGYKKATMSDLVTGKQRYNRDIVNDISRALKIEHYELLMPPHTAFALRRQRQDAIRLAAEAVAMETPREDNQEGRSEKPKKVS